jgi:2-keto-3-deoxy-L-rhamnonate aldolase RhmA
VTLPEPELRMPDDIVAKAYLFCTIPHPSLVEAAGARGFRGVVIDDEKFHTGPETVQVMCLAAEKWGLETLMRLRVGTAERIEYALNLGVETVLLPRLTSVEQVERLSAATRHVPEGTRGHGNSRASLFHRNGATASAPDVQVIIETPELLPDVGRVAAIDGVAGIDIGLADLTAAIGLSRDHRDEAVRSVILSVIEAAHAADKPVCMAVPSVAAAAEWVELGLDAFVLEPLSLLDQALALKSGAPIDPRARRG